jgi:sulfate adenylyltransferase subunit 2
MNGYEISHLRQLEAESIHILREAAAEFERPAILYSVGKDSSVMLRLAQKAFHPAPIPFALLHVDTGYKFPEMYAFRDATAASLGADLRVHRSQESGTVTPFTHGTQKCCAILKTGALHEALREGGHDAALGGARREEERSRAKERIFSFRDRFGQWDPRNQRPEPWSLYNGRLDRGETIRVYPLSNWTELDVWLYIHAEAVPVVPLYFALEREVVDLGGQLIPPDDRMPPELRRQARPVVCRFRTLGCMPCTGAVRSSATTVEEILVEIMACRISERSTRVIDHDADGSMETKKREGYF